MPSYLLFLLSSLPKIHVFFQHNHFIIIRFKNIIKAHIFATMNERSPSFSNICDKNIENGNI